MLPADVAERYAAAWPDETLPARAAAVCAREAERVAFADRGTHTTFAHVWERIERLAGWLAARARPGEVVSWWLPNGLEAAIVHHAALRAGCVPNPIAIGLRARELRTILGEARPAVLVTAGTVRGFDHDGTARALADEVGIPTVAGPGDLELALAEAPTAPPPPPGDPAALALLLYTSGSTGRPKGVQHTHRALLAEVDSFTRIHALTPDDRLLGGAPVGHIAGLAYGILAPLALGTSTAFLDRWDGARAAALAVEERATFMTGPPAFLLSLAEHARAPGPLRLFSTGGASIPTEAVREAGEVIGCIVKRAYGSTEVPTVTATTLDDPPRARIETDGRAIEPGEVRIAGREGGDAPAGTAGEIWARAPEMLAGYRDAALDGDAFTAVGWFRTGDVGALDPDGYLCVTGRRSDVIIRGGENISAAEIEDLLRQHPAVAEAAVVGMADTRLGERVCAVVALRDGASLGFDEMVAWLREREIATHKLPERLEVREELPKTEAGKVRKGDLRREID